MSANYNVYIVPLAEIIALPDGLEKTARLVAWLQGLYEDRSSVPVLVGGAAVELMTGGAYTTGDLDFVGSVPPEVGKRLVAAGFERKGRHWIHSEGQIFLEFPSARLEPDEEKTDLKVAGLRIDVVAPEALVVDRLAAWKFWNSAVDGVNAFLLLRAVGNELDEKMLERLATRREVTRALARARAFASRFQSSDPKPEELTRWAEKSEV